MSVTPRRRTRTTLIAAALTAAVMVMLTGCVLLPRGGQSFEAATAQLAALPGVASATVEESARLDGFMRLTSVVVEVELVDGINILDKQAFVNYLLAVAWSASETRPNMEIRLRIDHNNPDSGADWGQIVKDAGWDSVLSLGDPSRPSIAVKEAQERFGDWPGPIPEVPASLLTVGTTTPTPSPSPSPSPGR